MAFGITPRHLEDITFENLTQEQILVIALDVAKNLGWSVGHTSIYGFIAYTSFSWSSWSEAVTVTIDNHKISLKSECTGSQLFDWGKNKRNVDDFVAQFKAHSASLAKEELESKVQQQQGTIDVTTSSEELLHQPHQTSRDKITGFFSLFIPTEGYYITPIIVNLNIVLFILMAISGVHMVEPDTESLITWGANFRPVTLEGQWWRLLTSCFIHIGIFHLLMNLYALIYIGLLLEPKLGRTRFLAAYILAGIGGSVASLYWHELTVSAGASGAIFGMYGVFLAMLTTNLIEKTARTTLLTSILIFVGYNLVNGLQGGIDNAAHIGGLISGIAIGYLFYPGLKRPQEVNLKYLPIAAMTLVIGLSSFLVYLYTPNDFARFDEKMNRFAALELLALEVYKRDGNTPNEVLLSEIKDKGIFNWKECIKVLNEADQLTIPDELHRRNKVFIEYCELRIKSYEILYTAIKEDTDEYQGRIEDYNRQIEAILKKIEEGKY